MRHNTPQVQDPLRYYYEDGRGNKVWVQNPMLEYNIQELSNKRRSGLDTSIRRKNVTSAQHNPSVSGSVRSHNACGANKLLGDDRDMPKRVRWKRTPSIPTRRAITPPNRHTCFCAMHSGLGESTCCNLNDTLKWTTLPDGFLRSLIHSIDDAEYILGELRNEEQWLRKNYVCL